MAVFIANEPKKDNYSIAASIADQQLPIIMAVPTVGKQNYTTPLLPPLLPRALTCTALPHRRQVRGVVRSSGRAVHKPVRHRGPRPHGRRHYGVPRAERAQRPAQRQ